MTAPTTTTTPRYAHRAGRGNRPSQLDDLYPRNRQLAAQITGRRLFVVADGFGDDDGAAAAAIDVLAGLDGSEPLQDPVAVLDAAVTEAGRAIAARPGETGGSTLTALLLVGDRAVVAHLGDSRAYLVRAGRVERLTRDHTVVQSLVDEGRLSEDEVEDQPQRTLLNRALGHRIRPEPDLLVRLVDPGDRFVLTTDGVHGVVGREQLTELLLAPDSPDRVAGRVEGAVIAAGAPDNYGIVVVDVCRRLRPLRRSTAMGDVSSQAIGSVARASWWTAHVDAPPGTLGR